MSRWKFSNGLVEDANEGDGSTRGGCWRFYAALRLLHFFSSNIATEGVSPTPSPRTLAELPFQCTEDAERS